MMFMNYKKLYEKITDELVNEGYVVIENALNPKLCNALQCFAHAQTSFKKAGISGSNDLHIDANRRRDSIQWLDEDNAVQSEYLAFMNGLQKYLNKELYLGLSYYESHFALYEKGDFYEKHLDAFKNSKNRIVTTTYYLNDEWNEDDGGELLVYDASDKLLKKVKPKFNTLVVFLSDQFPHEVLPAKKKRYSIAGWFRVS